MAKRDVVPVTPAEAEHAARVAAKHAGLTPKARGRRLRKIRGADPRLADLLVGFGKPSRPPS